MKERLAYVRQFFYGFVLDFSYVWWITSVSNGSLLSAGVASVCIALPAILGYTAIFANKFMMIPYLLGLFFGTVTSMYLFH